jgi:hypothetical protein
VQHGVDLNNANYAPPNKVPNQEPPVNASAELYQQAGDETQAMLMQNVSLIYTSSRNLHELQL